MKIVINTCFGGFGLSKEAINKICEYKGYTHKEKSKISVYDFSRDDPILVKVVEELGEKSFGDFAALAVIEVPDDVDWYIKEYDGNEHVAEVHRTWP